MDHAQTKTLREPTLAEKEEARKVFMGKSEIFAFDDDGMLCAPDRAGRHLRDNHEYNQKNRGVIAAVVDLLLVSDPVGERFLLNAKEAATDRMQSIAGSFADSSDDHPLNTLSYINFETMFLEKRDKSNGWENERDEDKEYSAKTGIAYVDPRDEHINRITDSWADVLRCLQKHGREDVVQKCFPITQYENDFPEAFAFFGEHKVDIKKRAHERTAQEEMDLRREEFDGEAPILRAKDGFWTSARVSVEEVDPTLLSEVRAKIVNGRSQNMQ